MTQPSRPITCTRCRTRITVFELPVQFIDPARYVCGWCQTDTTPDLLDFPLQEAKRYDPAVSVMPL